MKLVMTLLVRDEADIVDAQLAFHLNAGVDQVIATDHRSEDGTTEILARYAREGWVHHIRESNVEYREAEWRTRMARLAATELGADWVIHSDADEFWWPRAGDLKGALATVPPRFGLVRAFWRPFVLRPDDGGFFAESMTVRLRAHAAINDPSTQFRPNSKAIHRADAAAIVGGGSHAISGMDARAVPNWHPVECLHFPLRSLRQVQRKASVYRSTAGSRFHDGHRVMYDLLERGTLADEYRALVLDDPALDRGLADGSLAVDTRLRDALRTLAGRARVPAADDGAPVFGPPERGRSRLVFPRPGFEDDADYAVEMAVLEEANLVRLQRRHDALAARLGGLEAWTARP
jgi:Glycosyl transferase family 2